MINDFFPFTFKSNVFQKVGERKRMNKGDEEERGQRCKSEKKEKLHVRGKGRKQFLSMKQS